jgi:hypothetical protein
MVDVVYHGRHVVIHEGPMADRRGTDWRSDAAKLEARDQERIERALHGESMRAEDLPPALRDVSTEAAAGPAAR